MLCIRYWKYFTSHFFLTKLYTCRAEEENLKKKKTQLIFVKVPLKQTGVIQFKKQLPKLFLKMV